MSEDFRPVLSDEQRKEDRAVEEMISIICNNRFLNIDGTEARDIAKAIYRQGYKK